MSQIEDISDNHLAEAMLIIRRHHPCHHSDFATEWKLTKLSNQWHIPATAVLSDLSHRGWVNSSFRDPETGELTIIVTSGGELRLRQTGRIPKLQG